MGVGGETGNGARGCPRGIQEPFPSRPDLGPVAVGNLATIVGRCSRVFQALWLRHVQRALEAVDA